MGYVVTIDGPAGSGKTSVSRILAGRLGYAYLDTGAMYRVVALGVKRAGIDLADQAGLAELCTGLDIRLTTEGHASAVYLGSEDVSSLIRNREMDMLSSRVSAVETVRAAMTTLQHRMAQRHAGVVAEGRDMGTVVFPDADAKFFLTASVGVRAHRRYQERLQQGEHLSMQAVTEQMTMRDHQDQHRCAAPLKAALDAIRIDSSALGLEAVVQAIGCHLIKKGILHGFSKING